MFAYILRRLAYAIPIVLSVALLCFLLVHMTPGDPLVAVLPADASQELAQQLRQAYGFDKPLPVQFGLWLWRVLHGDLGASIATGRPVAAEVARAVANTVTLAFAAALIGFTLGSEIDVIAFVTTQHFGLKNFGGLYGGLLTALSAGAALGPLAASAVFDAQGSYAPYLWLTVVAMAVSSLLLASLPKPELTTR